MRTTVRLDDDLLPDVNVLVYMAALAIESGSERMTSDRDYSRFPGLRRRDPGA
jgi:predicted nucleic acid-binding protein